MFYYYELFMEITIEQYNKNNSVITTKQLIVLYAKGYTFYNTLQYFYCGYKS